MNVASTSSTTTTRKRNRKHAEDPVGSNEDPTAVHAHKRQKTSVARSETRQISTAASTIGTETRLQLASNQREESGAFSVEHLRPCGTLCSILLENFMCHDHLLVNFHPCVTFISGQNGSGKSAILTAIQMALGLRASKTSRANRPQDFVKQGKSFARITIVLNNMGAGAYQSQHFGSKISICRKILKNSNSSQYSLSNGDTGSVVSRSLKDLQAILRSFNIQIDNPTVIMSQDVTRTFLAGDSASRKYEFFLRATQLSAMMEEYNKIKTDKETFQRLRDSKHEQLIECEKELILLEKKLQNSIQVKTLEEKIDFFKKCLIWANYMEIEQTRDAMKKKEQDINCKIEHYLSKIHEASENISEMQQGIETKRQEIEYLMQKKNGAVECIKKVESQQRQISSEGMRVEQELIEARNRILRSESIIGENENELKQIEQQKYVDRDLERKNLYQLEENKTKLEEKINQHKKLMTTIQQNLQELHSKLNSIEELKEQCKQAIVKASDDVEKLSQRNDSKLNYFIKRLPNLKKVWKRIHQHKHLFEFIPIGPIGLFLDLNDYTFASTIELELNNILYQFLVHSHHDFQVLNNMFKNNNFQSTVIIQAYKESIYSSLPDINRKDFSPEFKTMLSVLELDLNSINSQQNNSIQILSWYRENTNLVYSTIVNALIDWKNIEQIILMKDRDQAIELMFKTADDQSFRYQIKQCLISNGSVLFKKGLSENIISRKMYRSFVWPQSFELTIMQISQLNQIIYDEKIRYSQLEQDRLNIRRDIESQETELNGIKTRIKVFNSDLHNLEHTIKNTEILDDNAETLESDLIHAKHNEQEKIKTQQNLILHLDDQSRILAEKRLVIEEQVSMERKALQVIALQMQALNTDLIQMTRENNRLQRGLDQYQSNIEEHKDMISIVRARLEECEQKLLDCAEAYKKMYGEESERPNLHNLSMTRSTDVERMIARLNKELEQKKKDLQLTSYDDLEKKYHFKLKVHNDKKACLETSSKCLERIREGLNMRLVKWQRMRKVLQSMSSKAFNAYMSKQGHGGKLVFDDQEQALTVDIRLDSTQNQEETMSLIGSSRQVDARSRDQIRSLSGGEKSFSTVCFFLALVDFVEVPFRFLDEFDIFMDSLYRKKAIEIILEKAYADRKQLILISPLDTSQLGTLNSDQLSLVKLVAPRAPGQQLLDF